MRGRCHMTPGRCYMTPTRHHMTPTLLKKFQISDKMSMGKTPRDCIDIGTFFLFQKYCTGLRHLGLVEQILVHSGLEERKEAFVLPGKIFVVESPHLLFWFREQSKDVAGFSFLSSFPFLGKPSSFQTLFLQGCRSSQSVAPHIFLQHQLASPQPKALLHHHLI